MFLDDIVGRMSVEEAKKSVTESPVEKGRKVFPGMHDPAPEGTFAHDQAKRTVSMPVGHKPGWALDPVTKLKLKQQRRARNRVGVDESTSGICKVCGQTPCNCTHIVSENAWNDGTNSWTSEHDQWTKESVETIVPLTGVDEDGMIGPDSTSPIHGGMNEQRLSVGDPVIVTAPNAFKGKTGEISEFSPSGKFVIVNLYNHGEHSMHLSDVEYNQYADEEDEGVEEGFDDAGPVAGAITRRILQQRLDLLKQYGPELVGAAVDNVADYVGDVEEIGSSDVSAWVAQVERMLEENPPEAFAEGWQDFNKVEPYAVCLAGKPVKKFDYYEEARKFHDNWKKKLYAQGDKEKADKITLMPLNLDEEQKPGFGEFPPKQEITILPPKKLKSGETYQDRNKYWQSQGQAPIYKTNEVTNRHFGPKGAGTELARQIRAELASTQPRKGTPVPAKEFAKGIEKDLQKAMAKPKIQVKKNKGVAEGHADQQRKIFKKNGKPVGEVGIDRESSPGAGQWYMKCYARNIDLAGYDSYEEAVAELKHCMKQGVAEAVPVISGGVDPKIQFLQPTIQFAEKHGYKVTINPNPNGTLFAKLVNKQIEHTVRIGFSRGRDPGTKLEAEMTDDWDSQTWAWSARELAQDFKEFYRDALRDSPVQGQQGVAEGFFGDIKQSFAIGMVDKLKKAIPAQYHKHYDFDSVKSPGDTKAIVARARAAGHLKEQGVAEAKRRQRERDVDAGKPVSRQPKNPQTDYAKKRAQQKKELELGESTNYWTKLQSERNTKIASLVNELSESVNKTK